ncbi:tubulin-specific chaperone C [Carcharodon carcharias]|uniref:tubulin-specific chaperone C n=1 Tax=Carcharodon carcharias TaxID=13397 RepID=UPI001B7D94E3|nr:tubulin-specific chaperone C [Carcharodon carcharias]
MALVGESDNRENLTEEIPEYDRRKEKMVEILQRRDQERQLEVERRKMAKDVTRVKEEKSNFFTAAFSEEKAKIEALLESCEGSDRTALSARFEEISRKMQQLQKFVNDSMMFLSAYELRQAQDAVQKLQGMVVEKREECLPKKKFAFKSRRKEGAGPKEPKPADSPSDNKPSDHTVIEENLYGFSDADSQVLVRRADEITGKDVLLTRLSNCVVKLLGSPNTLHVKNVINSKVLCGPVSTSVFIDQSIGCTFAFACQQLRTHNTKDANVYLHVTSRAIVEDCTGVSFAPFNWKYEGIEKDFELAGLDRTKNNWNIIDDFNWLASDHSPNWSILAEESRITDWDEILAP